MKSFSRILLFFGVQFLTCLIANADLFVESIASTTAGSSTSIDYISTNLDPPSGDFHKVVVIVDNYVIAESLTPSGTLNVIFDDPGTIQYTVRSYSVGGSAIDTVERSINVFGIAIVQPSNNALVGLGSELFLGASAIFENKLIDYVEFQVRPTGGGSYSTISGSRDSTVPYAFLYEPGSTGLWDVRAVAFHPGGGNTASNPIVLQVGASNVSQPSYATILDPSQGNTVQAGVLRSINVDASTRTGAIRGVEMYVDGALLESTEGMDVSFPFRFDWTPRRPGSYSLVAILIDNSGMRWASEEVLVTATDDRPHAELILPSEGAVFEVGKAISLAAIAVGQGGARERVQGVEFLINGNAIPVSSAGNTFDDEAPYIVEWTPDFPGQYFVQARVVDSVTGASYQTPSITVSAVEASQPVAVVLSPYSGDFYYSGETVQFRAVANASKGLIRSLDFFVNDINIGTAEAVDGVYLLDYIFEGSGIYNIRARAISESNRLVDSNSVAITVAQQNGVRPSVAIENPKQGELYTVGDTIQLVANANDTDGNIAQVAFFVNQEPMGDPDTAYPYAADEFTFNAPGLYRFHAVATDSQGNLSKKAFVEVRATSPAFSRPTISISNPLNEATFEVGNTIFIEADAQDEDGNISEVRFEINGAQLGEADKTYPFQSVFYTLDSPGLYRIRVTAYDDEGYMSQPEKSVIYVVPASKVDGPQYEPLENNRDFLTQLFIDLFSRGPTDAERNRYLEKLEFGTMSKAEVVSSLYASAEFQNLRHSQNAFHAILGEWPSPLEFASVLGGFAQPSTDIPAQSQDDVGDTFSEATVLSPEGDVFSGVLEESGDIDVFTFQLSVESLVTVFTSGPFDTVGAIYNSSGEIIEYDDDSGEFFNFAIQRALTPGTYYIAIAGWGGAAGSYTLNLVLGEDVAVPKDSEVSNAELDSTIQFIYDSDAYQNKYGPLQNMDSESNRRDHFEQLYGNRFESLPTLQQVQQGSNRILAAPTVASFTSAFIRNDRVGLIDYIYNLPEVESRDDAALLLRSFLKIRPDSDSIKILEPLSFVEKVEALFASPQYLQRFEIVGLSENEGATIRVDKNAPPIEPAFSTYSPSTMLSGSEDPIDPVNPFFHIKANQDGWKYVEWLGWISDFEYPWIYHETLGWIQVNTLTPEELWVWHERLEWSYFAAGLYPVVYRYSDSQWVELKPTSTPGDFKIVPVQTELQK